MTLLSSAQWDDYLSGSHPDAHVLQSSAWGELKADFGWQPLRVKIGEVGAQVLFRRLPLGLTVAYIPKGPVGSDWKALLPELEQICRQKHAVFLRVEPDAWEDTAAVLAARLPGFQAAQPVQPRRTILIDLRGSEADWLARMKQKTRYNIRLAQKKGATIRRPLLDELPLLYHMYAETSLRDGFVIRDQAYYLDVWRSFMARGMAEALLAEVEGTPVAGLVWFRFGDTAYYLYGMSREMHRDKMPNYLLQWEAMRSARAAGCSRYDLWGAPDVFDQSDGMWGVFRFKEGLGGVVTRSLGAYDFPARLLIYKLYTRALPRLLDVMRRAGRARTKQEVSPQ